VSIDAKDSTANEHVMFRTQSQRKFFPIFLLPN
jgi:hypothetical protein